MSPAWNSTNTTGKGSMPSAKSYTPPSLLQTMRETVASGKYSLAVIAAGGAIVSMAASILAQRKDNYALATDPVGFLVRDEGLRLKSDQKKTELLRTLTPQQQASVIAASFRASVDGIYFYVDRSRLLEQADITRCSPERIKEVLESTYRHLKVTNVAALQFTQEAPDPSCQVLMLHTAER